MQQRYWSPWVLSIWQWKFLWVGMLGWEGGVLLLHSTWWRHPHFSNQWPFVRGIHRSLVNSPHKGQWCGAFLMFSLICVWINGWVNNREAGDLRHYRAHYDVTVMKFHWDIFYFYGQNDLMALAEHCNWTMCKSYIIDYHETWLHLVTFLYVCLLA